MTGPKPPPDRSWIDVGTDDTPRRFVETKRFVWIVVVAVVGGVGGLMALTIVFSNDQPGLVYDPQVVHREVTITDGRTVDCVVSSSGMSCDWNHPH